ncbi:MAG: hypothetical protein A3J79_06015 [Elusimicrobia bacterium RIFOXYB2_FULL_62_6]|nr:MAG: hypothetical protein A3J79_06015 [Elusimicrobia bacterium RIFOXYB2_FULL_62_6]
MAGVVRTANESLAAKDDLMLLSYLRFQMKEYPELELCLVTSDGHTAILGEVRTELLYRTAAVYPAEPPADGEQERPPLTVQLGFSKTAVERQLSEAYASLVALVSGAAGLGILLGLLGSWWVSRRLARPVTDLSAAVQKFGAGDLETSVAVSGRDEIAVLGSAFNRMASNIRGSVRLKEDLMSTLTHELNNPLAGLKSYLALLRTPGKVSTRQAVEQAYDSMAEAFDEMELTLSNALELFRTSAQPVLEPEKLDIGALVSVLMALHNTIAAQPTILAGVLGAIGSDPSDNRSPLEAVRRLNSST